MFGNLREDINFQVTIHLLKLVLKMLSAKTTQSTFDYIENWRIS